MIAQHITQSELQPPHCNDRLFIRWGASDSEICQRFAADLDEQLKSVSDVADHVVVVLHYLPFQAGVVQRPDPVHAFFTPYLGALRLGDVIRSYPKVRTVIHGHSHVDMVYDVDGITCFSCSPTPHLVEINT